MFFHDPGGGVSEGRHRGKVPFPSHGIKSIYTTRTWLMSTLTTWLRPGLSPVSSEVTLFPCPTSSSLEVTAHSPHLMCVGLREKDLHQLIWNFSTQICLFFPTYLFSQSLITSGWTPGYLSHMLSYNPIHFITLVAQILSALVTGGPSSWLLCPSAISPLVCACTCACV